MFFFRHPKPPSNRAVAVQVVQRSATPVPSTTVIILEPPVKAAVPPAPGKPQ
ncbi:MAG: hypothetical protein V4463_17155 [Pseudomonadota bacterium]